MVIFSGIAWLGLARSGWRFGAGWATHIVWDLALHGEGMASFVPGWYPLVCAGFDPVAAVAAGWRHRRLGRNLPGE